MRMFKKIVVGLILMVSVCLQGTENDWAVEAVYNFEEGEGYLILDAGPNEYHGIAHKGVFKQEGRWVEGKEGKAICFDAEEEMYLLLPATILGKEPQAGMIEFWLKPEKDKRGIIFSKYTSNWGGFYIDYKEGGAIRFMRQGDQISSIATTKNGNAPLGKWTHVKVVWDTDEGNKVYINEKLRAVSPPIIWTGGSLLTRIGCIEEPAQDPVLFFTGALDELKISIKPQ